MLFFMLESFLQCHPNESISDVAGQNAAIIDIQDLITMAPADKS